MQAQTSKTPEINFNPTEQVTPVIVKIGGDMTTDVAGPIPMNIDSPVMPFTDQTGDTWHEAQSTSTGRIHELSLRDGAMKTTYCKVVPQPDLVTSLEITFETEDGKKEQLQLSEVKDDKEHGKYLLQILSSGTAFTVSEPAKGGGWSESGATFTGKHVSLVFSQKSAAGGTDTLKFEYAFNSSDVHFSLDFHAPINQ